MLKLLKCMLILLLLSCSDRATEQILEGSWQHCNEDGYGELHCKNNFCIMDLFRTSGSPSFYYELEGDTLYITTPKAENSFVSTFFIHNISDDQVEIEYVKKDDPSLNRTYVFNRIESKVNPLNTGDDPYKKLLYERVFETRRIAFNCPYDTVTIPKIDLGTIDWKAYGIEDTVAFDSVTKAQENRAESN